jgi:hypothetical protein
MSGWLTEKRTPGLESVMRIAGSTTSIRVF